LGKLALLIGQPIAVLQREVTEVLRNDGGVEGESLQVGLQQRKRGQLHKAALDLYEPIQQLSCSAKRVGSVGDAPTPDSGKEVEVDGDEPPSSFEASMLRVWQLCKADWRSHLQTRHTAAKADGSQCFKILLHISSGKTGTFFFTTHLSAGLAFLLPAMGVAEGLVLGSSAASLRNDPLVPSFVRCCATARRGWARWMKGHPLPLRQPRAEW